jgi:hypothetical protein
MGMPQESVRGLAATPGPAPFVVGGTCQCANHRIVVAPTLELTYP